MRPVRNRARSRSPAASFMIGNPEEYYDLLAAQPRQSQHERLVHRAHARAARARRPEADVGHDQLRRPALARRDPPHRGLARPPARDGAAGARDFRGRAVAQMTITNENHGEIPIPRRECRDLGVPFRMKTLEKLVCHQGTLPVAGHRTGVRRRDRRLDHRAGARRARAQHRHQPAATSAADRQERRRGRTVQLLAAHALRRHRRQGLPLPAARADRRAVLERSGRHLGVAGEARRRARDGECRSDRLSLGFRHA